MEIDVKKPELHICPDGTRISFVVADARIASRLITAMEQKGNWVANITMKKKKRSLSSNALMWVILGEMADILKKEDPKITADYLYRNYVADSNNYIMAEHWESELPRLARIWEANGTGWFFVKTDVVEDIGYDRKYSVRLYYGSSQYDKDEMGKLIDAILTDAETIGVNTASEAFKALMEQYPEGQ